MELYCAGGGAGSVAAGIPGAFEGTGGTVAFCSMTAGVFPPRIDRPSRVWLKLNGLRF